MALALPFVACREDPIWPGDNGTVAAGQSPLCAHYGQYIPDYGEYWEACVYYDVNPEWDSGVAEYKSAINAAGHFDQNWPITGQQWCADIYSVPEGVGEFYYFSDETHTLKGVSYGYAFMGIAEDWGDYVVTIGHESAHILGISSEASADSLAHYCTGY